MPKRSKGRANGEGSVYEYPKGSGKWVAQIYLEDGTSKRRRASTQREAREKLKNFRPRSNKVSISALNSQLLLSGVSLVGALRHQSQA